MYQQSEKNFLNSNISSISPHNMVNFGPLTAQIGSGVWGAPQQISTGFASWLRYCTNVAQRWSTKLCTMFSRLRGWYNTYLGAVAPNGILPHAKFTLRQSLAFFYIGSVTARHSSSGCQTNVAAWYKEWNYGTFAPRYFHYGRPAYQMRTLYFAAVVSVFLLSSFFFSSPNLSGRRLDVYDTSMDYYPDRIF